MMKDSSDLIGKVLGTCTLERLIGRGGMGAVYLAQQTRPIRRVAVKVLLPNVIMSRDVYHEFLARFQREANLIAQLEHINIMPIYEFGEHDGLPYLVMPYLTGGSLREILARRGSLSLREAATYLDQAAAALDYAHVHGIIHRDLKPGNFLLHADGRLVLADFGIARMMQESNSVIGSTLTGTGMFLGTPEYMAPEMARGEQIDHRADIYELGIVLFQMLTGRVPFQGNTPLLVAAQHLHEPLPLLHELNPSIPSTVDSVIQKATAKKREDRFMSAAALAQSYRTAIDIPSSGVDERNIPTVLSPSRPIVPTVIASDYQTPPTIQAAMNPAPERQRAEPISGGFTPVLPASPITSPSSPRATSSNTQPWLIFIGILLVIALVIGGVLVGLQINRGGTNPSTGTATTPNTGQNAPTSTVNAPTGTTTTSSPTVPTSSPSPAPTTNTQPGVIPKGASLYSTATPSNACDSNGGRWVDYYSPTISCQSSSVEISNSQNNLAGTFLIGLPGGAGVPSNYVIEAQLQQLNSSHADFGIYFRNQPGNAQGAYTFIIHSDGAWSAYVYDNINGNPTSIASGATGIDAYAFMTIDVVANGPDFSFYMNGHRVGTAHDTTYSIGTPGIVVDTGCSIVVSDFALYTVA